MVEHLRTCTRRYAEGRESHWQATDRDNLAAHVVGGTEVVVLGPVVVVVVIVVGVVSIHVMVDAARPWSPSNPAVQPWSSMAAAWFAPASLGNLRAIC